MEFLIRLFSNKQAQAKLLRKKFHALDDDSITEITPNDYLQSQGVSDEDFNLTEVQEFTSPDEFLSEHGVGLTDISVRQDIDRKNADHVRFSQKMLMMCVVTSALFIEIWLVSIPTIAWVKPEKVSVPEKVQISMVGGAITNVFGVYYIVIRYFFAASKNKKEP